MLCRETASLALSMWCFRHLLGGKGSDGLAPARRKAEVDFPLDVQRGLEQALKRKQELLLKFRPKRQYQPQVTHLSFVYCLYYVNTFFGKYFCFYFIIKLRNLTLLTVASLARRVFSGCPGGDAGEGDIGRSEPLHPARFGPGTSGRLRARSGEGLSAGGSWSRPAGAQSQRHGEGRAVRALREAKRSPTCSPRARPCRLRGFLPRQKAAPLSPHLAPRAGGQTALRGPARLGCKPLSCARGMLGKGFLYSSQFSFFLFNFLSYKRRVTKETVRLLASLFHKRALDPSSLLPRCPSLLECLMCLKCSQNLQTALNLHFWSFKISFRMIFL